MLSDRFKSGSESVAVDQGLAPPAKNGRRRKAAPSSNGTSSAPPADPANGGVAGAESSKPRQALGDSANGRDEHGQFMKGNEGGPGNPFARQVAALRKRFLDATTPELFDEVFQILVKKMRAGDIQAIKLFLAYTIGKPAKAPEPDLLNQEELERFLADAKVWATFPHLINKPSPELPLELLRDARPEATRSQARLLGNFLTMPSNKSQNLLDDLRMMPRDQANKELVRRLSKKSVVRSQ
jgi:hypothetical protein